MSIEQQKQRLLPLREQQPTDFGGIHARAGFAYQDHVAASFCILMMAEASLAEVWCETYDDIVLVWQQPDGSELMEFVQAKNENLSQLYTLSLLLRRKNGRIGTSLFERSFGRDTCAEPARFRVVSSQGVAPELIPLTLDRDDDTRSLNLHALQRLSSDVETRQGPVTNPKGNDIFFWFSNTFWECHTQEALEARNVLALSRVLENEQQTFPIDAVQDLYGRLLWRVKEAAEAEFNVRRHLKILKKQEMKEWLLQQLNPGLAVGNVKRLRVKLTAALQPPDAVESAIEMRQAFNRELRQPTYLDVGDSMHISGKVRGLLHQLRTKLDSGEIATEGRLFHSLCVDRVIKIREDCMGMPRPPSEEFLLGCMYDITARCRHRFVRPTT